MKRHWKNSDAAYDARISLSNKPDANWNNLEDESRIDQDYLYMHRRLIDQPANQRPCRSTNKSYSVKKPITIITREDLTEADLRGGETSSGTSAAPQSDGNKGTRETHKPSSGYKRVKLENETRGHKKRLSIRENNVAKIGEATERCCIPEIEPTKKKVSDVDDGKNLVNVESEIQLAKRNENQVKVDIKQMSLPSKGCELLYKHAIKMQQRETISMHVSIEIMCHEYVLYVAKDDILELLAMKKLNISCIEFYILYLHSLCAQTKLSDYYGFVCPSMTWSKNGGINFDQKLKYFERCFRTGKKCFLAPHIDNDKRHWSLAAIYPDDNIVYWFDSLALDAHLEFKDALVMGLEVHQMTGGKTERKTMNWVKVACHRQPTYKECGYYVLTYMSNIINSGRVEDPTKLFEEEKPYKQNELDVTRCQWADYFLNVLR